MLKTLLLLISICSVLNINMKIHQILTKNNFISKVLISNVDGIGPILTDDRLFSLYMREKDLPNESLCYGYCAELFPPALIPENGTISAPVGVEPSIISFIKRKDNTRQLTYNNIPLYFHIGDKLPLDTKGHGLNHEWFLLSPVGKPIRALTPTEDFTSIRPTVSERRRINETISDETCLNLIGLYFISSNMTDQLLLYNFCCPADKYMFHCILYDIEGRVVGLKYVIDSDQFGKLIPEEKKFWHSHAFEVKEGLLVLDGAKRTKDTLAMKKFIDSYGKAIYMWSNYTDILPIGPPKLLMTFVRRGDVKPALVNLRDAILKIKVDDLISARKVLVAKPLIGGSDDWEKSGMSVELVSKAKEMHLQPAVSNVTINNTMPSSSANSTSN
jgi:predicted lipoprotein with Yx(FWY)xxD motif